MFHVKQFVCIFLISLALASCSGMGEKLRLVEGNFYLSRQMYDEAGNSYNAAADNTITGGYAEYGLGLIAFELGDTKDAALHFTQAVENPKDRKELLFRGHYNRGLAYFQAGNYEAAAAGFRQALAVDSGRMEAKRNLEITLLFLAREQRQAARQRQLGIEEADETAEKIVLDYIRQSETEQMKRRNYDNASTEEEGYPDH